MPGNEESRDIVKKAVADVFDKIQSGKAPDELIKLSQSMLPRNFGYWLHGFACAILKDKVLCSLKWYQFLKKEIRSV